uniref:Uncharacterized protein n=1 Tax=Tanacetum cinerariifolium TaxID=118510 RepID=A0A6L2MRR2_TANCI|nr:hypothetical protein [Tanacetum cinerariifolium]
MVNLPPPNNDPNVPKDKHAPAPEHALIDPIHVPIQPNEHLAEEEGDLEEELKEEEEPDDEEEEEAEEEDEEEMKAEEEEDMEFYGTFYVGEGSSATVINHALSKFYSPEPMINNPGALYARVKTLTKQMWDRFRVESSSFKRLEKNDMRMDSFDDDMTALDSALREKIQEMKKLMIRLKAAEEKAEYKYMEAEYNKNDFARVLRYYDDMRGWEYRVRNQLPLKRRYRERPYDPSTNTTSRPRCDDSYVMVRDNVVRTDAASDHGGEGVNTTTVVKDTREKKGDKRDDATTAKDS